MTEVARLHKRVFQIDFEHCPNCGDDLKIIATILEPPVNERIFNSAAKGPIPNDSIGAPNLGN